MSGHAPLLSVEQLRVEVDAADGGGAPLTIVDGVGFSIGVGERVAVVGESGCGKSVTARAILQLDSNVRLSGSVRLRDQELIGLSNRQLANIRGREIGMIFQDPLSALDPTMSIGEQVIEPLTVRGVRRKAAWERATRLLDELGIANAAQRMKAYPHELSGGMRQRVVMALALISDPALIIADEPTTALDVRVQAQVLDLLSDVIAARGLALLLITHDFGIVGALAERVLVMYAGRFVEDAPIDRLLSDPVHPYSEGLLASIPQISGSMPYRLPTMPGTPPPPQLERIGCAFAPRCPIAIERCQTETPALLPLGGSQPDGPGSSVACHVRNESRGVVHGVSA